ncbi:DUF3142 domain-containing protein [Verrucomicrobia bacterium]|nr:DUF3142 domain-containing protein [Verrucomicrobiota bacterium]
MTTFLAVFEHFSKFKSAMLLILIAVGIVLIDSGSVPRARGPVPQEVYVWQQDWGSHVSQAVRDRGMDFEGIYVLAASVKWDNGTPVIHRVALNYDALRASERPVGLAIRIEDYHGTFSLETDVFRLLRQLGVALVKEATVNEVVLIELQLDFDCAESDLAGYRNWVIGFKGAIGPVPVGITSLPSWLNNRECRSLFEAADAVVLQVHSLVRPTGFSNTESLCDPETAIRAVEAAASLGVPFRVALPTYGYLLAFDSSGNFSGVSAEGPRPDWPDDYKLRELRSDPKALSKMMKHWAEDRPMVMKGVVWYRLPVGNEKLNWNWSTLAAVRNGESLASNLKAIVKENGKGLYDLALVNEGNIASQDSVRVHVQWGNSSLVASDGISGFEAAVSGNRELLFLSTEEMMRIPAAQRVPIGWLRLSAEDALEVHIEVGWTDTQ